MKFFLTLLMGAVLVLSGQETATGETGVKKKRPLPDEYGRMVINNNNSERYGLAPVQFDHWSHRSRVTCRVCHVDIGFAMKTGATGIRAEDNLAGYYCGACHNGREFQGKKMFKSCSQDFVLDDLKTCERCHSLKKTARKDSGPFKAFAAPLPKATFGNGIDWVKAEEDRLVTPLSSLPGVSPRRGQLPVQKDFVLSPKVDGMPEIIFSHKKHTAWNGCEVCHPELFIGVKKGKTQYSMAEIFEGKYCGACHGRVAFPLMECERCHIQPVQ